MSSFLFSTMYQLHAIYFRITIHHFLHLKFQNDHIYSRDGLRSRWFAIKSSHLQYFEKEYAPELTSLHQPYKTEKCLRLLADQLIWLCVLLLLRTIDVKIHMGHAQLDSGFHLYIYGTIPIRKACVYCVCVCMICRIPIFRNTWLFLYLISYIEWWSVSHSYTNESHPKHSRKFHLMTIKEQYYFSVSADETNANAENFSSTKLSCQALQIYWNKVFRWYLIKQKTYFLSRINTSYSVTLAYGPKKNSKKYLYITYDQNIAQH